MFKVQGTGLVYFTTRGATQERHLATQDDTGRHETTQDDTGRHKTTRGRHEATRDDTGRHETTRDDTRPLTMSEDLRIRRKMSEDGRRRHRRPQVVTGRH